MDISTKIMFMQLTLKVLIIDTLFNGLVQDLEPIKFQSIEAISIFLPITLLSPARYLE